MIVIMVILISCEVHYNVIGKDKTKQQALMPLERKINELGCSEREKGIQRTEKLIFDQKNRKEYMVPYRMLKFYVKMAAKVTK